MSIRESVITLVNIQQEIQRLNKELGNLRKAAKKEESSILKYMQETGKTGLKFNGSLITLKQKQRRERKKKVDKEEDLLKVLQKYGLSGGTNTSQKTMISELTSAMRGNAVKENSILFKKSS
jgi:hypothetical protein